MSLSSVLVDSARVITSSSQMVVHPDGSRTPLKIEGTTQTSWVYSQTFDCRIDSPAAPEANDAPGGRVRTAQHPTMIYELEDYDGNPVVLTADDRVEVTSEEFGVQTFQVTGEPEIARKKQDEVCGIALLVRVLDFDVPTGPTTALADAVTVPVHVTPGGTGSAH